MVTVAAAPLKVTEGLKPNSCPVMTTEVASDARPRVGAKLVIKGAAAATAANIKKAAVMQSEFIVAVLG